MRVYVASSWRNGLQSLVVEALRTDGHEVYDFKNPPSANSVFRWMDIDPTWKSWTGDNLRAALSHPVAEAGFKSDWDAMQWAEVGVLLLPCGRSAHLEAGYFVGAGKPLYVLLATENEPELMYKMATGICVSVGELCDALDVAAGAVQP